MCIARSGEQVPPAQVGLPLSERLIMWISIVVCISGLTILAVMAGIAWIHFLTMLFPY